MADKEQPLKLGKVLELGLAVPNDLWRYYSSAGYGRGGRYIIYIADLYHEDRTKKLTLEVAGDFVALITDGRGERKGIEWIRKIEGYNLFQEIEKRVGYQVPIASLFYPKDVLLKSRSKRPKATRKKFEEILSKVEDTFFHMKKSKRISTHTYANQRIDYII